MLAQRKYPDEVRELAVKMVFEVRERDGNSVGNAWHRWQLTPGGLWSAWSQLDGSLRP